jgi:hypothetical protein
MDSRSISLSLTADGFIPEGEALSEVAAKVHI